jgi:hypothetical protein
VFNTLDADGRNGRAFDGAEQYAAQAVTDGGAKAALKRLRCKHAIPLRKGFGIGDQSFGFLKAFEHRRSSLEARSQESEVRIAGAGF